MFWTNKQIGVANTRENSTLLYTAKNMDRSDDIITRAILDATKATNSYNKFFIYFK